MRKAQLSLIDLALIIITISIGLQALIAFRPSLESISDRKTRLVNERLINAFFSYEGINVKVINYLCNAGDDPFNESVRVIESLNTGKNFIMFIENKSWTPKLVSERLINNGLLFYNNETKVCLNSINLISKELMTNCGELIINYGSWDEGELTC